MRKGGDKVIIDYIERNSVRVKFRGFAMERDEARLY
jgi:hypothetical protein